MAKIDYNGADTLNFYLLLNIEYPDIETKSETRMLYSVTNVKNHRKFVETAVDILLEKRNEDLDRVAKLLGLNRAYNLKNNEGEIHYISNNDEILGFVLDSEEFLTPMVGKKYTYTIHAIPTHEAGI